MHIQVKQNCFGLIELDSQGKSLNTEISPLGKLCRINQAMMRVLLDDERSFLKKETDFLLLDPLSSFIVAQGSQVARTLRKADYKPGSPLYIIADMKIFQRKITTIANVTALFLYNYFFEMTFLANIILFSSLSIIFILLYRKVHADWENLHKEWGSVE